MNFTTYLLGDPKRDWFEVKTDGEGNAESRSNLKDGDFVEFAEELAEDPEYFRDYNSAIDGLESFLLALAGTGLDLGDPRFQSAFQTCVETLANQFT